MKLIVGLGNPGKEYDNTRHNIGFMILDKYLENEDVSWQKKFKGEVYVNNSIIYLKPSTYMNNSGESVFEALNYYHVSISDVFIIQDDLDMNFGTYKVKKSSESGGHNGIKSIIKYLNSKEFGRLKIGINTDKNYAADKFVLGKFTKEELNDIENNMSKYISIIDDFINNDIDYTINHQRKD